MQLLVIRHGSAEEVGPDGDDSRRSLTKSGRAEVKEAAAGLLTLVETIDVIASSLLVRAQETAEIVARAYGDLSVETVQSLIPGSDLSVLADWLARVSSTQGVAIVGHEPHLGL